MCKGLKLLEGPQPLGQEFGLGFEPPLLGRLSSLKRMSVN